MTPNQIKAREQLIKEMPKFAREDVGRAFDFLIEGTEGLERTSFTVHRDEVEYACELDLTPTQSQLGHDLLMVALTLHPTNKDRTITFIAQA